MANSLPSSEEEYHVQFSIEGYSVGSVERMLELIYGIENHGAIWEKYEEYVEEVATGRKHLSATLAFDTKEDAVSVVESITDSRSKLHLLKVAGTIAVRQFQGTELVETVTTERV